MNQNHVPPHLTIYAFETNDENQVINIFNQWVKDIHCFSLYFVSIGIFKPSVLYITPVLSNDLISLQTSIDQQLKDINYIKINNKYQPYHYFPHVTIAKTLNEESILKGMNTLYHYFSPFHAHITHIGLSKTNPYINLILYKLKEHQ